MVNSQSLLANYFLPFFIRFFGSAFCSLFVFNPHLCFSRSSLDSQLPPSSWILPGSSLDFSASPPRPEIPCDNPGIPTPPFPVPASATSRIIQPLLVHHQHPLHTRTIIFSCVFSCPIPRKIPSHFWRVFVLFIRELFPYFCSSFLLNRPLGLFFPRILCVGLLGSAHGSAPGLGHNTAP